MYRGSRCDVVGVDDISNSVEGTENLLNSAGRCGIII